MKIKKKRFNKNGLLFGVLFRYLLIVFVSLGNLFIFYKLFTPLTIYPIYFILKIFYENTIYSGIIIYINNYSIIFIKSCIAGSAYFLLFALSFLTPMKPFKRVYFIFFTFSLFLILNILRILILIFLLINNSDYFDITHKFMWYVLGTIIVIGIWFFSVRLFNVKEIPIYSDFKILINIIKNRRK
ncbi:MAG: pacearchaeosortase [Candidatus Pacearchaeota archaeon]